MRIRIPYNLKMASLSILLCLCFFFYWNIAKAQADFAHTDDYLSLIKESKMSVPLQYKDAAFVALTYFPQLKNTTIVFKEAKIKTTMSARPVFASLFKKKNSRKYIIRINNCYHTKGKITLDEVPFNAQIGVIGHELAHIDDYAKRNFIGIIQRGLSYFSKKSKARFEKEIDLCTLRSGLGQHLYSWAKFVLHESDASKKYVLFKKRTYLTPEEITSYLEIQTKHAATK